MREIGRPGKREQRAEIIRDGLRLRANRIRRGAANKADRSARVYRFNAAYLLDRRADRINRHARRLARQRLNELRASYGLAPVTWEMS